MIYQRIQYFLKTAETGSFSKAAKELYVSPQALTKQVGLLEDELGVTLLNRNPRGVLLSEAGKIAYDKFRNADLILQNAISEVKELAGNSKPTIGIGVYSALPQDTIVAPLLTFLLAKYSDYQLSIELIEMDEGRNKLLNGQLDLLLTNTHQEDLWDNCKRYSYGETDVKVVVSLLHPWTMKDRVTVEDLKSQTFIKMDMEEPHYTVPREQAFYENIPCKKIRHVTNFNTLLALLAQGEDFAVIPMVFSNIQQAKLKSFDYPGRKFSFNTALIYNESRASGKLTDMVREIVEEFDLKEL